MYNVQAASRSALLLPECCRVSFHFFFYYLFVKQAINYIFVSIYHDKKKTLHQGSGSTISEETFFSPIPIHPSSITAYSVYAGSWVGWSLTQLTLGARWGTSRTSCSTRLPTSCYPNGWTHGLTCRAPCTEPLIRASALYCMSTPTLSPSFCSPLQLSLLITGKTT